jgi:hypothetical protein
MILTVPSKVFGASQVSIISSVIPIFPVCTTQICPEVAGTGANYKMTWYSNAQGGDCGGTLQRASCERHKENAPFANVNVQAREGGSTLGHRYSKITRIFCTYS